MNKFVQIGDFILDVVLSESHRLSADVTDFPVEEGGSFSDHIRAKPLQFTVEGIITNTPLPSAQATQLAKGIPILSAPSGPDAITGGALPTAQPGVIKHLRSDQAYKYLHSIWDAGQPVTVRTSLGVFEQMAMIDLDIPRSASTGDAIKFTATFQQIRTITNERMKSSRTPGYGGKNRRGNKTGDPNVGARVLWKRGIQPGGPVIFDTKYVEMRADKKDPAKTRWWYVKSQPISLAAINYQTLRTDNSVDPFVASVFGVAQQRRLNPEVASFFSFYGREENRPLSERETFWLLKDLQRDNIDRRFKNALNETFRSDTPILDTLRAADTKAANQARSSCVKSPYDPDILRRPIQDPSKMQRSVMQQQGEGQDPMGAISSKKPLNSDALSNAQGSASNLRGIIP